ncbi:hypothetical protein ACS0TY_015585 [Phlomoides rotata]
MGARAYFSLGVAGVPFNNTTTTRILTYTGSKAATHDQPIMPDIPPYNDTPIAHRFNSNLSVLVTSQFWTSVPLVINEACL